MPRFATTWSDETRDVRAVRCTCDGCDGPRPVEEHTAMARVWLLTSGRFELRDARGRLIVDPATLLVLPAGHAFTIRHPVGADTCLAFGGPIVDALAAAGPVTHAPAPGAHAALFAEVHAWRRGERDDLAIAEALCAAAAPHRDPTDAAPARTTPAPPAAPTRRERELAHAIAADVRLRVTDDDSLSDLAARAGVSIFHAARTFARVTGAGIHAFRRELRLRHALALLADSDLPLAQIALETGFAGQSHLTNRFRARFGVTPRAARLGRVGRHAARRATPRRSAHGASAAISSGVKP